MGNFTNSKYLEKVKRNKEIFEGKQKKDNPQLTLLQFYRSGF